MDLQFLLSLDVSQLESIKDLLFDFYAVATICVVFGVFLEREEYPKSVQDEGWRLLIRALAVETLLGIVIFSIDAEISSRQRAEIIALQTRLAARTLSDDQFADVARRLNPFWPQTFQIIAYWKNKESKDIADRIASALGSAGWTPENPVGFTAIVGVVAGVEVHNDKRASDKVRNAAKELVAALNDNGIAAEGDEEDTFATRIPSQRIDMQIGIKP